MNRPDHDCTDVEQSLGALVLGALEPAERDAVETHVRSCPRCSTLLAELAPLPGLLNRIQPGTAGTARPGARSGPRGTLAP
jgi:anti-sigma factor RsiW